MTSTKDIAGHAGPSFEFLRAILHDRRKKYGPLRHESAWPLEPHSERDIRIWPFKIYYDRTFRREPRFQERRNTVDLDLQHRFKMTGRQELIWGLGYRYTKGDTESVPTLIVSPRNRADNLFSAFLQDEIVLVADHLRLTVGSKIEHNDYTGFEFQPSMRVLWTPAGAALSVGIDFPGRQNAVPVDRDVAASSALSPALPFFARLLGNKGFRFRTAFGLRDWLSDTADGSPFCGSSRLITTAMTISLA